MRLQPRLIAPDASVDSCEVGPRSAKWRGSALPGCGRTPGSEVEVVFGYLHVAALQRDIAALDGPHGNEAKSQLLATGKALEKAAAHASVSLLRPAALSASVSARSRKNCTGFRSCDFPIRSSSAARRRKRASGRCCGAWRSRRAHFAVHVRGRSAMTEFAVVLDTLGQCVAGLRRNRPERVRTLGSATMPVGAHPGRWADCRPDPSSNR
jgi:hypothetical protein